MPVEETVTLSEADAQFVAEQDLDLDALLEDAVARKRRQHEYENPDPHLTDEVRRMLGSVFQNVKEGRYEGSGAMNTSFAPGIGIGALSHRGENELRLWIDISQFDEVTGESEPSETLRNSGAFCETVWREVSMFVASEFPSLHQGDVLFSLTEHETELNRNKVRFETEIPFSAIESASVDD